MFRHSAAAIDFADKVLGLARDQSKWSQETFGSDAERGPIGALKHLQAEAQEAIDQPADITEYADCYLLIMDAARRAGFAFPQLIDAAVAKHRVCEGRNWPKPETGDDAPVFHVAPEGE